LEKRAEDNNLKKVCGMAISSCPFKNEAQMLEPAKWSDTLVGKWLARCSSLRRYRYPYPLG
jgi:hypothetical protein